MLDPASEIQATLLRNHTGSFAIALFNASMNADLSHTKDMVPEDLLHRPVGSGYFAIALLNALTIGGFFMSTAALCASSS
jgi:hypothetical protein